MSSISPMRTPERRLLSFLGDGEPPESKPEGGAFGLELNAESEASAPPPPCWLLALRAVHLRLATTVRAADLLVACYLASRLRR